MRSRLHTVLTLLLAGLMLGAGVQSAVCELACGLGSHIQCHGVAADMEHAAGSSNPMAGMHCSGMMHASSARSHRQVQFESRDGGSCKHPSSLATLSTVAANESAVTVHWIVVEAVPAPTTRFAYRMGASADAPSCHPPVDSLLISLRV